MQGFKKKKPLRFPNIPVSARSAAVLEPQVAGGAAGLSFSPCPQTSLLV